jgi:hypothetical protein
LCNAKNRSVPRISGAYFYTKSSNNPQPKDLIQGRFTDDVFDISQDFPTLALLFGNSILPIKFFFNLLTFTELAINTSQE